MGRGTGGARRGPRGPPLPARRDRRRVPPPARGAGALVRALARPARRPRPPLDPRRHLFARHLDLGETLYLGGDSGLRGSPLRYQDGDRRFLFTVEQRFYTDWHPLRLAHVGAAIFFDAGRAWSSGVPEVPGDLGGGWLRDVGIGLRLSPSRSSRAAVIHLDLAVPLDGDPSIAGVQWVITSKESF